MIHQAVSFPNISLIKSWGNRQDEFRLPAADSLSMTLNTPAVEAAIEESDTFILDSTQFDGTDIPLTPAHTQRFQTQLELTKKYLASLGMPDLIPASLHISIQSGIPPKIGIAASAAVFCAMAEAYGGLAKEKGRELTREEVSVIARLGSMSACRSVYGGFVAMVAGEGDDMGSAHAVQIANELHWKLHDVIIVPGMMEKEHGSTEGHQLARTSPDFPARVQAIQTRRQKECTDAILTRDFEKLQKVAEEDCMDMHKVMQSSTPPLNYWSEDTHHVAHELQSWRKQEHIPVLFTMDAGPTVHMFCTDEARPRVLAFAKAQKHEAVFEAHVGGRSRLVI